MFSSSVRHHNTRESIPFILASFSLDLELVHLKMEDLDQDIQYDTSSCLVGTTTPETNIPDTDNDKTKYIKAFLQPHHSYPEPLTTQDHHTPPLKFDANNKNLDDNQFHNWFKFEWANKM